MIVYKSRHFLGFRKTIKQLQFKFIILTKLRLNRLMTERSKNRVRRQRWYTTISLTLILFILGCLGLFTFHTQSISQNLKEQINIIVELKSDATKSKIDRLESHLIKQYYIKQNSVTFIDKETGAAFLREDFGDDFLALGLPNPLYDIFTFNVSANYIHQDSLAGIKSKLLTFPIVQDVFYERQILDLIASNLPRINWAMAVLGIILILVSITLIYHTIGLSMYADRFLIKNMQLVGAKWSFIRKPYLKQSTGISLISAILAIGGVLGLTYWLNHSIPGLQLLANGLEIAIFAGILIIFSVILIRWSTRRAVNRHLKSDLDDLYTA